MLRRDETQKNSQLHKVVNTDLMSSFGVAGGSELEMGPEKAKSHFQDVVRERGGSGMILIAPINIPLVMINYNGAVKRFFPSFFPKACKF